MTSFKEIVTKAILGKAKKTTVKEFSVECDSLPDTVLGCWVINHDMVFGENNIIKSKF